MAIPRMRRMMFILLSLWVCGTAAQAVDWMINEDYKQLDPRGASDFDILLQGNVAGQITGGGFSPVTNPFANPTRTATTDPFGNTVVRFVGSNTIPADPNADRHVGIYGTGPKPRVLVKAWSFATDPKRVPVPKSNFAFFYDAGQQTLRITVENTSPDTVAFSEVGVLVSLRERPIEQLTRRYLPPDAFDPLAQLNGEYAPGTSLSVEIPGVAPTAYAVTYATVKFAGSSAANAYKATGGEWAQVAVASQKLQVVKPVDAGATGGGSGAARGLLLLPFVAGACLAAGPRFRRRGPGRRRLPLWALSAALALASAGPLTANVYILKLLPTTPNDSRPKIEINGVPITIDTGCAPGFYVSPATAGTLGLNTGAGTPGSASGVGGSTPTTTGVPVPPGSVAPTGASAPITPGGQAATTPPMPTTTTVGPCPDPGLIGSDWLRANFFYGDVGGYFWLVEKDQGAEGVATANSMALFLAGVTQAKSGGKSLAAGARPAGTRSEVIKPSPPKVLPAGTQAQDGGWVLGVDVTTPSGTTVTDASFLIKTGSPMTLISERLANQLGLNIASLPRVTTLSNFGSIQVRQAKLSLALFADPSFPVYTIFVGVTDRTTNPFGENFLGQDVLGALFSWEISAVEGDNLTRFFAAP